MSERRERYETDKPPLGTVMVGWTADISLDDAESAFRARFGYEPRWIIRTAGAVLAGPVREGEDG